MPGAREILSFVLETDATKAVKGFEDTEKSASRMGTTMTKVGAVVAGAGVAVGIGLVGTVKQFEQAEASANKFQTAVTGMGSKIDTARIKRLATDLQQVSTVTNDQVIAAARWGAVYGLTTSQLEELLAVSVDLAAQTGKSLDVVTKALAKAASGEGYTALTKLGLTFDETAYKADSFGTTVSEATAFAGGAAAKNVDTMSGQLTRLGNNWDDVKEQIGAGANEVFEPLAKAGADFAEKAAEWNPQLLKSVGHFAAIGSVAATTFGTVATIGGQIANISEGFSGLSGLANKFGVSLKDAQGNATGLGKAVSGIGAGAGVLMGAVAIYEVARAIGEATENTRQFDTALKRLSSGAASTPKAMAKEFQEMAASVEGWDDKLKDAANVGFEPTFDFEGFRIEIDNATEALDKLSDMDAEEALAMIDEIQQAMSDEDGGFWGSGAA
ncbi:MAG TPA: hypothetical protein VJM33_00465, partial [Microthrixaceae bacterium]|nr:hypothetical protein [Microthrixaceae bacterium]